MKTLYFLKQKNNGVHFGVKPINNIDYSRCTRKISLADDLNWEEPKNLQPILVKSDIWDDFPIDGTIIINYEFQIADEKQRVDILLLRNDGYIIPCELKIRGKCKDTHGQLIRYISDIYSVGCLRNFISTEFKKYIEKIKDDGIQDLTKDNYNTFIKKNGINKFKRYPNEGYIIDVDFKPQLIQAIKHLNHECNFHFTLIQISTKVPNDWNISLDEYYFKLDFEIMQI